MIATSKQIVFFGTEDFSLVALRRLVENDYTVAFVVTKPDRPNGRGKLIVASPVKRYAQEHNIPVLQPNKLTDIIDTLRALDAPVGVLVSYGKIIPQQVIDLFTPGIINIHPSLLPKYRGPSPIETAILNGDTHTGVSIMQLSAAMDAGPVYRQLIIPSFGNETAEELYETLGNHGATMLQEILPSIIDGSLLPTRQDDTKATYCQLIQKTDGIIDWNQTAATIERKIRAYHEWPQSRTTIGTIDVIVTSAQTFLTAKKQPGTIETTDTELFIYASDIALRIKAVKPLGKKEMPIQAFLAGYRSRIID